MAIEDADRSDSPALESGESEADGRADGVAVTVGEYTWAQFMAEHGYRDEVTGLYGDDGDGGRGPPTGSDWENVEFDPAEYLGFHPDDLTDRLGHAAGRAKGYQEYFLEYLDPETTPVTKGRYGWEHFKREYYYDASGRKPLDKDGTVEEFDAESWLGFDPEHTEGVLSHGNDIAESLSQLVDDRTVSVNPELDEDAFFTTVDGRMTVTNRYDLEKAVPLSKKLHFRELDRYWVNKPYAFVTIFHSDKENETKYYLIEPHLNPIEKDLQEFLTGKLRDAIKYSDDDVVVHGGENERRAVIERETRRLLDRYDLHESESAGFVELLRGLLSSTEDESNEDSIPEPVDDEDGTDSRGVLDRVRGAFSRSKDESEPTEESDRLDDIVSPTESVAAVSVRPEPILLEENRETITETQVTKILYYLKRNFIGYQRIDGIKHDINVEDISCDGYNSPVFVYHTDYEQIISNIYHGERRLDDFVVKLAQRSGKGISKRRPQVDATLPDGSRAQLTLGREVSDHGTNYTIRQFKDVPFTPIDLINWKTFSLEEMAFLWLCIENNKSLIFAGGTASGKTTSLNAVSLFIPSNAKIVSIEDTREVELPQRNWIASITRPSFTDDDKGNVDEFDLLEAALRQRPDYIVMGEIRGEEGRTLFQVMSTGHTTYTTFHADSVGEVLKRFTTAPINVSKTMFTALDLVSVQTSTRVQGNKVRRNKSLTEINHYDPENDEINVKDIYQWQAETDEFLKMGDSNTLDEIKFDRGWNQETLDLEMFKRQVVLAYLIVNGLNEYRQVAATLQAFINDPDTIMTLIALDQLEVSLEDLRTMESVLIDVDPEKEALVPRPDPTDEIMALAKSILEEAEGTLFEEYRSRETEPESLSTLLASVEPVEDVTVTAGSGDHLAIGGSSAFEVAGELEAGDPGPADSGASSEPRAPDEPAEPASPPASAEAEGAASDGDTTPSDDSGGSVDSPTETADDADDGAVPPDEPAPEDDDWVWKRLGESADEAMASGETNGGTASADEAPDSDEEWSGITFGFESDDDESSTDSGDEDDGSGGFGDFGEFESVVIGDEFDDGDGDSSVDVGDDDPDEGEPGSPETADTETDDESRGADEREA